MILGTNECLLNRACELGYEVHAFGLTPPNKLEYAGKEIYFHKQDIMDYETLWNHCKEINPKGVVSVSSELAMHPMHYLLRKLDIPCNSVWTEQATTNKYLMRTAMKNAGLDSPKFTLITSQTSLVDIENVISEFNFPLIIKPTDLSASRGVMKIDKREELKDAIIYSLGWSKKKECILEECVSGPEYSGECIAYNGKYNLLAITEKTTTGAPHFVETAHRQPASLSSDMIDRVRETLFKAFSSLRIEYGAIHPEFRITKDGRIIFMEIATRMGGDHIGTELTPISSGYDFIGMVIDISCGKEPNVVRLNAPQKAEVHYIISEKDLKELDEIRNDEMTKLVYVSEINELPKEVNKSSDRAGYYIVTKTK